MTAGTMSAASTTTKRRAVRSRLTLALLGGLSWLLPRLPDRPLHGLAHRLGGVLYLMQPRRRRLVRDNLGHVCRWLVEQGLASPPIVEAATSDRALGQLVRAAYGHYVRAYLESLILERYAHPALGDRIQADDPVLAERLFGPQGAVSRPLLLVGLHFGAIEIPALWAVRRGVDLTSPMETLSDPHLQDFVLRRRTASGVRLIPLAGAHRELTERLSGGGSVGLVADRLVAGSGMRTELFGRPARLPIGPAVLALESGVPAWAVAVRRVGWGEYRARLEPVELPGKGTRRERLAGFMANEARAFERLVADAPEQWWTLFFPIWREEGR